MAVNQATADTNRLLRIAPMCLALPVKWQRGTTAKGRVRERKTWLRTAEGGRGRRVR